MPLVRLPAGPARLAALGLARERRAVGARPGRAGLEHIGEGTGGFRAVLRGSVEGVRNYIKTWSWLLAVPFTV